MQRYDDGKLVNSSPFTPESHAQAIVAQKMKEWEIERHEKEKELNAKFAEKTAQLEIRSRALEIKAEEMKTETEAKLFKITEEFEIKAQALKKEKEELQEARKALAVERQQMIEDFETEKKKMVQFQEQQSGLVKLNIGGKLYQTSRSTLTKYKSFFFSLFSGRFQIEKDENSAIFIDREGKHFGLILNYLRDGILPPEMKVTVRAALKAEAEFYQLEDLIHDLDNY